MFAFFKLIQPFIIGLLVYLLFWQGVCFASNSAFSLTSTVLADAQVVLPTSNAAVVTSPEVSDMRLERDDDGLFLSVALSFDLPTRAQDAAQKGIALLFITEVDVLRDRWYWYDRLVSRTTRYQRLAYQPLTRRWRLQISSEPIGSASMGVILDQSFETLENALTAIRRISNLQIATVADIEPNARYNVDFRFHLDMSKIQHPFHFGTLNNNDWNLSLSKNIRWK